MFLEEWIHHRIRQAGKEDPEYHRNIREVTKQEIESFQLSSLRKVLAYVCERNSLYRDLFSGRGVTPDSIRSLSDLAKIPFAEISASAQSPYKFLCVSLEEVAQVFTLTSSGTTGRPKKVFFTQRDAEMITDYMAAVLNTIAECAGLSPKGWVVQIFLPNGTPMSHANLAKRGVEKMGGLGVIGSIAADTEKQIETIERTGPTMLIGSAFRIYRITQEAKQSHDLRRIGVKLLLITSEYLSNAMRKNLQDSWNAEVYHHYGMSEVGLAAAIECQSHDGFHFNEAEYLFEVVDPETGEPLKAGEEGELVVSTLSREGTPLIRYKTGDMASLTHKPCQCGASTLQTISKVNKRVKSIIPVGKAGKIYPSLFDEVLYTVPSLVDYRILLTRKGEKGCLICRVELSENKSWNPRRIAQLISNIPPIKESIKDGYLTEPQVELADRNDLKRRGRVKQRIVDNR